MRGVIGEMIIRMIVETDQAKGVEVILAEETEDDEEVPRDIWATGKPEAEDKGYLVNITYGGKVHYQKSSHHLNVLNTL